MNRIFRLPGALKRDPAIGAWMQRHSGELGALARHWFDVMRGCGEDVRELLHDGHPTACIGDVAFAYVNAKLRPDDEVDAAALGKLVTSAYRDLKRLL